jgi:c-di-AMP phosphodiesterase-like protein
MSLKDISCCFVIGRVSENETGLSARSDGTVNVQLLCEKMGGGGHFNMAAASFLSTPVAGVEHKILDILDTYLNEARSDIGGRRQ